MLNVLRGVAQSGLARMVRVHEAGGSNPLAPTKNRDQLKKDIVAKEPEITGEEFPVL